MTDSAIRTFESIDAEAVASELADGRDVVQFADSSRAVTVPRILNRATGAVRSGAVVLEKSGWVRVATGDGEPNLYLPPQQIGSVTTVAAEVAKRNSP